MTAARTSARHLAVALTALSIAACDNTLSNTNPGPGEAVTSDIGVTARDEVEAIINALTLPSSLDPVGTAQMTPTTAGASSPGCVSSSTPTDSDGDGVPDNGIYVFTAPPCRFTGWRGGTMDVVGQLRIQDPAVTQPGFGYEANLTKLRTRFTSGNGKNIFDITRDGTRALSGSVASLVLSADLHLDRTFAGKPDAAVEQRWTVTYTPATSLQINLPVPSGALVVTGTLEWERGTEHFVMTVTTPTPLHYNTGCTDTVQRIDAGELRATGTFDDVKGYVRLRWSECGKEPSYLFVAT
jgi:hypothetical protein